LPDHDVVTFGEALAVFDPATVGPLSGVRTFHRGIGGAEVNLAVGLVRLGHRVSWAGRVGRDSLGDEALSMLRGEGVDITHASRDPHRPTGLYIKELGALGRLRAHYFRADTAACRTRPENLDLDALVECRLVHLTGITAALSDTSHAAALALLDAAGVGGVPVCFDANLRRALLQDRDPRPLLAPFLERCDVLLLSAEESRRLLGTADRDRLAGVQAGLRASELVVHDHDGAFVLAAGGLAHLDARRIPVVDPVGAGDAFAAGYLSGRLRGWDPSERLRLAELCAAAVISVLGDNAGALRESDAITALSDQPVLER